MGYRARIPAEARGLTDDEPAAVAQFAPLENAAPSAPLSGHVRRNGRSIAFTLDATPMTPETYRLLPEHLLMAILLLVSFIAPIRHLLG